MSKANNVLKGFYPLSEYYNFIKQPENSIVPQRLFSIVPIAQQSNIKDNIFSQDNLYHFVMSVQSIELPEFNLKRGDIGGTTTITTPLGAWSTINNTTIFTGSDEIKMYIYELQDPIIENWIYNWCSNCTQTNTGEHTYYPLPKLNIAIKYFRSDSFENPETNEKKIPIPTNNTDQSLEEIIKVSSTYKIKPNFVYWITGLYPISMQTFNYNHTLETTGGINRSVTFAYDMMICLNKSNMKSYPHDLQNFLTDSEEISFSRNKNVYKNHNIINNNLYYWYDVNPQSSNSNNSNNIFGNSLIGKLFNNYVNFSRGFNNFTSYLPRRLNKSTNNDFSYIKTNKITSLASQSNVMLTTNSNSNIYTSIKNTQLTTDSDNSNQPIKNTQLTTNSDNSKNQPIKNTQLTTNSDNSNQPVKNTQLTINSDNSNQPVKNTQLTTTNNSNQPIKNTQLTTDSDNNQPIKNTQLTTNSDNSNNNIYTSIKNDINDVSTTLNTNINIDKTKERKTSTELLTNISQIQTSTPLNNKDNNNFIITKDSYKVIKVYANNNNTTPANIIRTIKSVKNTQEKQQLIIQLNQLLQTNQINTDIVDVITTANGNIDIDKTEEKQVSIELLTNISNEQNNDIVKNNSNILKSNIQTQIQSINNVIDTTNANIVLNNKPIINQSIISKNTNLNNVNNILTNKIGQNNTLNKTNYNLLLNNALNNILKQQRTSSYTIEDYKKQLDHSLNLLTASKSLNLSSDEFKMQLNKTLKNINRKQAKKLTDMELGLFVNSAQLIFNEQYK